MIDVSFIVPVYNTERYVARCISTILGQTHSNIELILVDDGSKDRSGEILDSFAAKDSRVMVIHKENGGVSSARNAGLEAARGEFVSFIDSDDWIAPNTCELALKAARDHSVDLVQYNFCKVVDGRIRESKKRFNKEGLYPLPSSLRKFYNTGWNSVCLKLIRRSFLLENGLKFFDWSYHSEDQAFSFMMFSYLKEFYCISDVCYFIVSRRESAIHSIDTAGYLNRVRTLKVLQEELVKRGRHPEFIRMARKFERHNALKARFAILRSGHRV